MSKQKAAAEVIGLGDVWMFRVWQLNVFFAGLATGCA